MGNISKLTKIKRTSFEGNNGVAKLTAVVDSSVGYATYIGSYCRITKCRIGRFCSIAHSVEVVYGNHPTRKFVSTHPAFYSKKNQSGVSYAVDETFKEYTYSDENKRFFVEIDNDVWIGANAQIMSGVHIGNGAIVAAGAVVTQDVPPYAIVGGVPAKIIRYRFREEEISFLEELAWWNKDEEWIRKHAIWFSDINILKDNLTEGVF